MVVEMKVNSYNWGHASVSVVYRQLRHEAGSLARLQGAGVALRRCGCTRVEEFLPTASYLCGERATAGTTGECPGGKAPPVTRGEEAAACTKFENLLWSRVRGGSPCSRGATVWLTM
jgi:hypothetical protein